MTTEERDALEAQREAEGYYSLPATLARLGARSRLEPGWTEPTGAEYARRQEAIVRMMEEV